MRQITRVFVFFSLLTVPLLLMAQEFRSMAGYDCADKLELAANKYAECTVNVHSTQAEKKCADLVAMVYCKKLDAASAGQGKKVSLK